ncbi:hypothetical protein [Cupriavidus sp. DL-D2]|uniref:hypothetical protein n=1 Tax=Cupriavidus sp. DL-D2 TaxID=3144974 RepID=UPI0032153A3F
MKVISIKDIPPLHIGHRDTLSVTYHDHLGQKHALLAGAEVPTGVVDCIKIVRLEDEHGFESGFGALLGKKK